MYLHPAGVCPTHMTEDLLRQPVGLNFSSFPSILLSFFNPLLFFLPSSLFITYHPSWLSRLCKLSLIFLSCLFSAICNSPHQFRHAFAPPLSYYISSPPHHHQDLYQFLLSKLPVVLNNETMSFGGRRCEREIPGPLHFC